MNKDTFYFSHDYNAANDVKILFLRQKYGMLGYGIYWFIVESLAQSGGELPYKIIPVLAMQMQVEESLVTSIVKDFNLFVSRETTFVSERLLHHLSIRKSMSDKGKLNAQKRWGYRKPNGLPNGESNAKESKVKEIIPVNRLVIE